MNTFYLFSSLIALVCCQSSDDYYDYVIPMKCEGGAMDEVLVDEYIIQKINHYRKGVLHGYQSNGSTKAKLPKAKVMKLLQWGCDLEKKAIRLLNTTYPKCSDSTKEPVAPKGHTGFFFSMDTDFAFSSVVDATNRWLKSIESTAVSPVDKNAVRYHEKNQLRDYLNLMHRFITGIGCGQIECRDGEWYRYRVFCLTNKPPLKENQIVWRVGKGGCLNNEPCPKNTTCVEDGFCS